MNGGRVVAKFFVLLPKSVNEMKTILIFIALGFLTMSCETEEVTVTDVPEENLTTNTTLKNKLLRVLQSPTAVDNLIDGSGCFAIKFPYTVVANGQQVNLVSEAGYAQVQGIFNANGSGGDNVTIQFPVTVRYADYSEAVIASQAQFNAAVSNCVASTELSCVSLGYPVNVKTYDSGSQLAASFDISTGKGLFDFLNNIEAYDAVVLNYPIQLNTPDGTPVTIDNNQVLGQKIDTYTQQCLNSLNLPEAVFQNVIQQGTWYVSGFIIDTTDQTANYQDYDFTFNDGGTIMVSSASPSGGLWDFSPTSPEVMLMFMSSQLANLSDIWTLMSVTTTTVTLHAEANGAVPERYLTLSKN